jgi:hypothetical protein
MVEQSIKKSKKNKNKKFKSRLFEDRNEKLLYRTIFLRKCKKQLQWKLEGAYLNHCFIREISELLLYIIFNGSLLGGIEKSR